MIGRQVLVGKYPDFQYASKMAQKIAKMGGDDDREDKERVMAGFLSGSENVR